MASMSMTTPFSAAAMCGATKSRKQYELMIAGGSATLLAARIASMSSLRPSASVPAATGLTPAARRPRWAPRRSSAQVMKVLPTSVSVPVRK